MGQCTKPGGFKACSLDSCIGCGHHVVVKDFDEFFEELNEIEFEKTRKQLRKLFDDVSNSSADTCHKCAELVPLMDCQHITILVCEYGYICQGCNKQMKFVDGKFVEM